MFASRLQRTPIEFTQNQIRRGCRWALDLIDCNAIIFVADGLPRKNLCRELIGHFAFPPAGHFVAVHNYGAHAQIGQIKNQLNTHHAELQGAWKGESSAAFTQVYNLFETEFAKVLKDLDLIQEKLVHTKAKYQTAEQNKTARVNTLKGLVNG